MQVLFLSVAAYSNFTVLIITCESEMLFANYKINHSSKLCKSVDYWVILNLKINNIILHSVHKTHACSVRPQKVQFGKS